jgi:hypothetical protein
MSNGKGVGIGAGLGLGIAGVVGVVLFLNRKKTRAQDVVSTTEDPLPPMPVTGNFESPMDQGSISRANFDFRLQYPITVKLINPNDMPVRGLLRVTLEEHNTIGHNAVSSPVDMVITLIPGESIHEGTGIIDWEGFLLWNKYTGRLYFQDQLLEEIVYTVS